MAIPCESRLRERRVFVKYSDVSASTNDAIQSEVLPSHAVADNTREDEPPRQWVPLNESIWHRQGVRLMKQHGDNFAELSSLQRSIRQLHESTIADENDNDTRLVDENGAIRHGPVPLFYAGDGAPIVALQKIAKQQRFRHTLFTRTHVWV